MLSRRTTTRHSPATEPVKERVYEPSLLSSTVTADTPVPTTRAAIVAPPLSSRLPYLSTESRRSSHVVFTRGGSLLAMNRWHLDATGGAGCTRKAKGEPPIGSPCNSTCTMCMPFFWASYVSSYLPSSRSCLMGSSCIAPSGASTLACSAPSVANDALPNSSRSRGHSCSRSPAVREGSFELFFSSDWLSIRRGTEGTTPS
mmetsp:Transcript_12998/g.26151  ORF Transcript_12998/g.26151 Transcript_12998/m.26151 type:complete len:201 (+) Transcript_12998:446-1048(+)